MRDLRGVSFLSGAICLLGILGCDAGAAGTSGEQEVTSVKQGLVSYWSNYHGGGGGSWFNSHDVYPDMRIYNPRMKCGSYVDQIFLKGEQAFAYGPYGAGYGGVNTSVGTGDPIVGVKGRAGAWIDQLTFVCRRSDGSTYDLTTCGTSTGGDYFEEICGTGTSMVAVAGRAGNWLDGIQIGCGSSDISP